MNSVSIGLLLPNSTVTPMGKDFEKGLKKALHDLKDSWEIEIIPEFIAEGSRDKVDQAINKCLGYHDVDVVSGILSNKVVGALSEKMEKSNKAFLFSNIGEYVPDLSLIAPSVYLNSDNSWQHIWALGNWGVRQFGPKGMFVGGLYDAGYSFAMMLQMGMKAASEQAVMPFAVAPVASPGAAADVEAVFQHIENFAPDFVFAAFCGDEATSFLGQYIKRGYHKQIPLLGLPFLIQPFSETSEECVVYSAFTAPGEEQVEPVGARPEDFSDKQFFNLGYESGLMLKEALKKSSSKKIKDALAGVTIRSSRGSLSALAGKQGDGSRVFLVKNKLGQAGGAVREVLEELDTIFVDDPKLKEVLALPSSGWFNPYPAV